MILPLARALTGSAGAAAFRAVGPLYAGIAIVAAILFGPQGMTAADAVDALDGTPALRVGLWAAWLLAAAPAARLIFDSPDTFYLRSLPVARWRFCAVHAAHLVALQLPWIVLHARGGGLLAAAGAAMISAGAHALLCARSLRPVHLLAAALAVLAIAHVRALEIPAGIAAAAIGTATAFRRAPERTIRRRPARIGGRPLFALAQSYRLAVRRQAPATLVRALLVTASGAAVTALAARNNRLVAPDAIAALSLGTLSFFAVVATGGIDRVVADAEQATGWLLDAAGTRRSVRLAAASGAVAVYAAGCGLLHGGAVAAILGGGPAAVAALAPLCAVWAAALAAAAARLRRRRT